MNYKLITDSCCELTAGLKASLGAEAVPLTMTLGEESFLDDAHLDRAEFLEKMRAYPGKVQSACPSPDSFAQKFANQEAVFVVTLSSNLSGSYSSAEIGARIARKNGTKVHVFDSKSASAGELLICLKIQELAEAGLSFEEIVQKTEAFIEGMHTYFILENLDNLVKNGRMSKIVGGIAMVMNIRPILGSDGNGNIAFFGKARGAKGALAKLVDLISQKCPSPKDSTLVITHCSNPSQAQQLEQQARERCQFQRVLIQETGGLSSLYANLGGVICAF